MGRNRKKGKGGGQQYNAPGNASGQQGNAAGSSRGQAGRQIGGAVVNRITIEGGEEKTSIRNQLIGTEFEGGGTHKFKLQFFSHNIKLLVTRDTTMILCRLNHFMWKNPIQSLESKKIYVGFCIRRAKGGNVTTVAFCSGSRCMVIRLTLLDIYPDALHHLLNDSPKQYVFVGLNIKEEYKALLVGHHHLRINPEKVETNAIETHDIRTLASKTYPNIRENTSKNELSRIIFGEDCYSFPAELTTEEAKDQLNDLHNIDVLNKQQVLNVCLDAVLCLKIAETMRSP